MENKKHGCVFPFGLLFDIETENGIPARDLNMGRILGLYQRLGFRQVKPYYDNPLPGALYWELVL